ncbi:MAG: hydrogenase maturation protease [Chloroflexi bacterium]|nr:hydrogenase maturation protease [Chloroflexota bacterium]
MPRTLIIGYGNLDRADDGVAYWVINAMREGLGQEKLGEDSTGLEELGARTDSIFLTQIVPELVDTLVDYDQVVFVDAHVIEGVDGLYCTTVEAEYVPSTFTHHVTPSTLLALLKMLYHKEARGYIVSLRGYHFDFHRDLSMATDALIAPAVEEISRWIESHTDVPTAQEAG